MSAVVVDHHDQIAVPSVVGDLIDPDPTQSIKAVDPTQSIKAVDALFDVVVDPGDDRADRAPSDAQQLTRRRLRGAHRQPRHHVIEVTAVADTVSRPRHRDHRADRACGTGPEARRLRRTPSSCPRPTPATDADRRHGHSPAIAAGTARHDDRLVGVVDTDPFDDRARQPAAQANRGPAGGLNGRSTSGPRCSPAVRTTTR